MSYYNQHAQEFFDGTINVEMESLYRQFLPLVKKVETYSMLVVAQGVTLKRLNN